MRFWFRKKHKVELVNKPFVPLSQVGDDTLKAMTGHQIIVSDEPDFDREVIKLGNRTDVAARMMDLALQYGPGHMSMGPDGLWTVVVDGKAGSGKTRHEALDALERALG